MMKICMVSIISLVSLYSFDVGHSEGWQAGRCPLWTWPVSNGPDVYELAKSLDNPDATIRKRAARDLARLGPGLTSIGAEARKLVPALNRALADDYPEVRAHAACALRWLGQFAESAVPRLGDLLKDSDSDVRRAAALALQVLGPVAEPAVSKLKEGVKDEDRYVRLRCSAALASLKIETASNIERVVAEFGSEDLKLRSEVIYAAGDIGPHAIPEITRTLKDPRPCKRLDATGALARAADMMKSKKLPFPSSAVDSLVESLKDRDKEVACNAIYALSRVGAQARTAVPAVTKCLGDPEWSLRWSAAYHLKDFGAEAISAIPALETALGDSDERVRSAAAESLRIIRKLKVNK